jgi:hypothetical protein
MGSRQINIDRRLLMPGMSPEEVVTKQVLVTGLSTKQSVAVKDVPGGYAGLNAAGFVEPTKLGAGDPTVDTVLTPAGWVPSSATAGSPPTSGIITLIALASPLVF